MTGQSRARYLLRFDDLCPRMNAQRWHRFWPILHRYQIRPILAVIPKNEDPELEGGVADLDFWKYTCSFQDDGASIALHGFRHLCDSKGSGLIPIHCRSEFAGVAEETQRTWIEAGLGILRSRGLNPTIWVAPRHGFDQVTLKVLRDAGIDIVSDGFASAPFRWHEMTWIPQQLWAPVQKDVGVWTICLHPGTATDREVSQLADFLERFGGQFTSVQEVLAQGPIGPRSLADRMFDQRKLVELRLSACKRRLSRFKIQ